MYFEKLQFILFEKKQLHLHLHILNLNLQIFKNLPQSVKNIFFDGHKTNLFLWLSKWKQLQI